MADARYNFDAARTPNQRAKMDMLAKQGICAFCIEHFETYHDNPVEFRNDSWTVARNDYPYPYTDLHFLLVPHRHVTKLGDLTREERNGLMDAMVRIEAQWGVPSYAIGMRVGDPRFNGGSVEHLHAHFIVATRNDGTTDKVRFKMS